MTEILRYVIDAGHGAYTGGKRSPDDSLREFHFNAAVAESLAVRLLAVPGVEVYFAHDHPDGGIDVSLTDRVKFADNVGADVFISIHANAYGNGWNDANGIETFTSMRKNAADVELAALIQAELIAATGLRDRGVKHADFYVITNRPMPSVLVECGFMTNPAECELLKSDAYRDLVADAIFSALYQYNDLASRYNITPEIPEEVPQMDEHRIEMPQWFADEFGADAEKVRAAMSDPLGTYEFWRTLAIMFRVGKL